MTIINQASTYVARDLSGELWQFEGRPEKMHAHGFWKLKEGKFSIVEETTDAFRNVRWEDDEPAPLPTGFHRLDAALTRNSSTFMSMQHKVRSIDESDVHCIEETQSNPKYKQHEGITKLLNETYRAKNKDYGDAFGKSHEKYGAIAGLTRMSDKFNRIEELILTKEQLVADESVLDTLLDLANYSIMLYMELSDVDD